MDKDEALKLALEALEEPNEHIAKYRRLEAIADIKEALAQPEQEPVANGIIRTLISIDKDGIETWKHEPFYTTAPQRKPEQKPVAFRNKQTGEFCTSGFLRGQLGQWTPLYEEHTIPLYITPPQRKPLTEREILDLLPDAQHGWTTAFYGKWVARAVERAHGIKE